MTKERYHALRAAGKCTACARPLEEDRLGKTHCLDCSKISNRRHQDLRDSNISAGLCAYGGCKAAPEPGRPMCASHLAKIAATNRAWFAAHPCYQKARRAKARRPICPSPQDITPGPSRETQTALP